MQQLTDLFAILIHTLHDRSNERTPSAMQKGPLTDRIAEAFETLAPQMQAAARFVLDRPSDVALLSMREQARRAGVQPHTMTRFAQSLGFTGYDELRDLYAAAIREGDLGFSEKAGRQVARQKQTGDEALAAEIAQTISRQVAGFTDPRMLERLAAAARRLGSAERIYCLGLRSCFGVVSQFAYVMSFLGERAVLLDSGAGTGLDPLRNVGPGDAMLAVSVAPYMRATVEGADYATGRGAALVAITDSPASPLARIAREAIIVPTESPSFYHAISPAFVAAEILAALIAGRGGDISLAAIRRTEDQMRAFGIHLRPDSITKSSPAVKPSPAAKPSPAVKPRTRS